MAAADGRTVSDQAALGVAPPALERAERETAGVKLNFVQEALTGHAFVRARWLERHDKVPLLRGWNARSQALGETVRCLPLAEGWTLITNDPLAPETFPADDVVSVETAGPAAEWLAGLLTPRARTSRDGRAEAL